MHKAIIGALAVAGIFSSAHIAAAQESKAPPTPRIEMMRGMNSHMAEMEKRMGGMHQTMEGCMTNDKNCPTSQMMTDMQTMHTQMTKMMADMKSMSKGDQPGTEKKTPESDNSEDHEQHH